jgi:chemotaxis protein CheZ
MEKQLLQVLIDNTPLEKRSEGNGLLNGPQMNADENPDAVSDQEQVDDLLSSLGF